MRAEWFRCLGFRGLGLGHRGLGLALPLSKTWIQQGLTASMGTFVEAGVFQKGGRGVWPGGVDAIKWDSCPNHESLRASKHIVESSV